MVKPVRGVVAAGDPLTSDAGAEILRAGGNAYDAAIAATFTSFVASSSISSAGGGGFLMADPGSGNRIVFDFFTQTPLARKPNHQLDFHPVNVDFGDKSQEFHIGLGAAAVPGNVAGLFEVHRRLGRLPMSEIVIPAIENARKGVALHKQTKYQVDILKPILTASDAGQEIYMQNGKMLDLGQCYFMPNFAETLDYLAKNGPREFYEGEIARSVADACTDRGGHLTVGDFESYKVQLRKPLSFSYRSFDIHTNPPPNAGGPLIAFLLKLLEAFKIHPSDYASTRHLNWLTQGFMKTAHIRSQNMSQLLAEPELMSQLSGGEILLKMRASMEKALNKSGNTTHVSVVDQDFNVASVTTSVGEGCGFIIPGTDIMLNNMLGEEDLNVDGFHQWQPNTRISSMMAPTVVSIGGRPVMGLGSGGSNRIRSAIAQAIVNFIDFKLDFDAVVNSPRIHWERGQLDIEPGFDGDVVRNIDLPPDQQRLLWSEKNMYFGGVHAVFIDEKGNMHGAGDRRRAGSVSVA